MDSTDEHTPPKTLPLRVLALTGALALFTAGCGITGDNSADDGTDGGGGESSESDGGGGQAAELPVSTTVTAADGYDLEVEVRALERIGDEVLRLTMGVGNNSDDNMSLLQSMAHRDFGDSDLSGVTLLDTEEQKHHIAFSTGSGDTCYCGGLDDGIEAGTVEEAWVTFPEPTGGAESVTVMTPITPPFHDIPVTDAEETEHPDLDEPVVLDLQETTDELAGGSGDEATEDSGGDGDADGSEGLERSESDDEINYDIASDVLFATDSASLNDDAEQALEQVADDIDEAGIETVHIDGHTDDTGDDEINGPLSEDRAAAVEELLTGLVDTTGADYEVEGHGSADPVADNDTDDGREQNRRVEITLDK